jgi:tetratricopeptide (TPR) repeat protein
MVLVLETVIGNVMKTVQCFLCLACLVGTTLAVQASNPKVDSLLHALQSDPHDRVEVLWGIAYELFDVDNAQALFYAERAYKEVWKRGDSLQIVKVGTTYGQLLRRMDEVTKSIEVSAFILPIAKRHDYRKYTKMLLNSLGVSYIGREEYDKALEYHLESLTMRELDGDIEEIAVTLSNLGLIQYRLGDYELGISYLNRAIAKSPKQLDQINLTNLGFCYLGAIKYTEALSWFSQALEAAKNSEDEVYHTAMVEYGFAKTYCDMGIFDSAKAHCATALKLVEHSKTQRLKIFSLVLMAQLSRLSGDLRSCDNYLTDAERLDALKEYPKAIPEIYKERSHYYAERKDYHRAFDFSRRQIELDEKLNSKAHAARVRAIHASYSQRENMSTIKSQSEVLALKDVAIFRQRLAIVLFAGVILLIFWMAWILKRSNDKTKRINRMLDERVHERTVELGANRSSSQHTQDEQTFLKRKVAEEVLSAVATLRGISYLGEKDLPAEYLAYFDQARSTADKIEGAVSRLRV